VRAGLARVLIAVAVIAIAWSIIIGITGGVRFAVAGRPLSSTSPWKPLEYAVVAGVVVVLLRGVGNSLATFVALTRRITPARASMLLAVVTTLTGLTFNSWTASGPDPFAYVSQAALWRHGQLDLPVPLAANVPWPDAVSSFTPFGYRAGPGGAAAMVPITAPGVPMVMALLQRIAGHGAAFVVTPAAGGLLVLLTFSIGLRLRSPGAGLIAAWLVATSPVVLYMLMWPMSDIPAAAITALLIWCLLRSTPRWAVGAGLAAAAGVLTRPSFAVIACAAGLWLVFEAWFWQRGVSLAPRALRIAAFVAGLLPGAIVLALLNTRWFGSPLASGYGTAGDLFAVSRIPASARLFAIWVLETSPVAWIGLVALLVPASRLWVHSGNARTAWLLRIVVASAVSVYLLYEPFSDWWYLRFLLPAWPAIFVAAAVAIDAVRTRGRAWAMITVGLTMVAGVSGVVTARNRAAFNVGEGERRYVTIARLVDASTDASAVILTSAHSGTIRYYAGRETLRFDGLDQAWLDRAIAWLASHGRHPYILVEDWEQPLFEARFRRANQQGDLSYPPILAWESVQRNGWVWLYDPLQHATTTKQPGAEAEMNQPRCAGSDFPALRF
jgi:hypothetical protein